MRIKSSEPAITHVKTRFLSQPQVNGKRGCNRCFCRSHERNEFPLRFGIALDIGLGSVKTAVTDQQLHVTE
jgi:hypothetical protein